MRDKHGLEYLESLPPEAIQVKSVWYLIEIDPEEFWHYRLKPCQLFVYSQALDRYEVYSINENMRDFELEYYISKSRLFFVPLHSLTK